MSERKVVKAIAHGAASIDEIGQHCRAGTTCQGCHDTLDSLLTERLGEQVMVLPRRAAVA